MAKNIDYLVHSVDEINQISAEIETIEAKLKEFKDRRAEMNRENYQAKRQHEIKTAQKMTAARAAVLEELVKCYSTYDDKAGIPQTVSISRNWGSSGHYARYQFGYYQTNPRPQVVEGLYEAKYIYLVNSDFRHKRYAISDEGCEALDAWRKKQAENK